MDLSDTFFEIDWHDLPVDFLWFDFDANRVSLQCNEFDDEADEYKALILTFQSILTVTVKSLSFENISGIGDFYDAELTNLDYEHLESGNHHVTLSISMGVTEAPSHIEITSKELHLIRRKEVPEA